MESQLSLFRALLDEVEESMNVLNHKLKTAGLGIQVGIIPNSSSRQGMLNELLHGRTPRSVHVNQLRRQRENQQQRGVAFHAREEIEKAGPRGLTKKEIVERLLARGIHANPITVGTELSKSKDAIPGKTIEVERREDGHYWVAKPKGGGMK